MVNVCRTCTQQITTSEYFYLDGSSCGSSTLRLKDMIQSCIPQFNTNLTPNPVICRNCFSALFVAYHFKSQALKNEEVFHRQLVIKKRVDDLCTVEVVTETELYEGEVYTDPPDLSAGQAQSMQNADEFPVIECPPLVPFDKRLHVQKSLALSDNSKTPAQYCLKLEEKCQKIRANVVEDEILSDNEPNTESTPYEKKTYQAKQKARLERHTGEKPYSCSVCGNAFKMKGALDKHKLLHVKDRPFKCQECGFRCKEISTLVGHIRRVHMGRSTTAKHQASICHICGKKLSGPAALHTHMNIHSGVKAHQCSYCGRCFRERAMLKNHLVIHTGEKPFKCKNCDYTCSRRAYLLIHVKAFGDHPNLVKCHLCGNRIACKSLLQRHLNSAHRNQIDVGSKKKAKIADDYQGEVVSSD